MQIDGIWRDIELEGKLLDMDEVVQAKKDIGAFYRLWQRIRCDDLTITITYVPSPGSRDYYIKDHWSINYEGGDAKEHYASSDASLADAIDQLLKEIPE